MVNETDVCQHSSISITESAIHLKSTGMFLVQKEAKSNRSDQPRRLERTNQPLPVHDGKQENKIDSWMDPSLLLQAAMIRVFFF